MAVIFPIVSTFNPKGVNQAQKSIGGLSKQANLLKAAFTGVGIAAVAKGLQSSVLAASSLSESIAKSNTVFGQNAEQIQAWSKTTAKSLGVSQKVALEAAGTYGNLFRAFGINEQESAKMSQSLVTLAADLASFNDVPIEDALLALRSGLSGETEPLKRFGIALNEARLKEQALAMGLITTTKGTLPQVIKTQAAYALILKDSALAQGDVTRTADSLANQMKFLKGGLEDAKAGFGEALLPIVTNVVTAFNDRLLPAIQRVVTAIKFEGAGAGLQLVITEIATVITNLEGTAKKVKDLILLFIGIKTVAPLILGLAGQWTAVSAAIGATATTTQIATGVMKRALISTGIGALIVAAGFLASKIYDIAIASESAEADITISTDKMFDRFGTLANQVHAVVIKMDELSVAARHATDSVENARLGIGTETNQSLNTSPDYTPPPVDDTGETEAEKKAKAADAAADAAAAMAKVVADAAKRASSALTKMNEKLTKAREKLQAAKDAFASFRDGVRDSITGLISFSDAASRRTGNFLQNLRKQATSAVGFADKVKQLIKMGLSETGIQQVLAAGADAGGKIANELIAGGAGAIAETNALLASVASAAKAVAKAGANQFYKAGVTQGQALVNGIIASVAAAGFSIKGGEVVLPSALQKAIDSGSLTPAQVTQLNTLLAGVPKLAKGGIVNKPTLALIGESGPEAVVPLSGRNSRMGNTINITVNAGMGANGTTIGKDIVDAIKKYERVSGPVFLSA